MRDSDAYFDSLVAPLLPKGPPWRAPLLLAALRPIGDALARLDQRTLDLMRESDPRRTVEMLEDWELALGLPDPCTALSPTVTQRRGDAVRKFLGDASMTPRFYMELAWRQGFDVMIVEFHGASFNHPLGEPLTPEAAVFTWAVLAPPTSVVDRRVGDGMGEGFRQWGNARLECLVSRLAPAHTQPLFVYVEPKDRRGAPLTWLTPGPPVDDPPLTLGNAKDLTIFVVASFVNNPLTEIDRADTGVSLARDVATVGSLGAPGVDPYMPLAVGGGASKMLLTLRVATGDTGRGVILRRDGLQVAAGAHDATGLFTAPLIIAASAVDFVGVKDVALDAAEIDWIERVIARAHGLSLHDWPDEEELAA